MIDISTYPNICIGAFVSSEWAIINNLTDEELGELTRHLLCTEYEEDPYENDSRPHMRIAWEILSYKESQMSSSVKDDRELFLKTQRELMKELQEMDKEIKEQKSKC